MTKFQVGDLIRDKEWLKYNFFITRISDNYYYGIDNFSNSELDATGSIDFIDRTYELLTDIFRKEI